MTTLDDKFKPQEGPPPAIPESEEEPPRGAKCGNPALRELWDLPKPPDLNLRERRPATEWLALLAFAAFLALSFILPLLRRR